MKNRSIMGVLAAVVALALMVALAACGEEEVDVDKVVEQAVDQATDDSGAEIDACAIVTQQMASEIFGNEAVKDEGIPVIDPSMMGECLWTYDTETSGQLLQFRVWDGEIYYSMPSDAEAFDLGDQGYIRVNEYAGIDISWVQEGKTIDLSYSTVGPDSPELQSKVPEMKDLAMQVSDEL